MTKRATVKQSTIARALRAVQQVGGGQIIKKELDALAGWTDGGKTAQVYTRNASRKILAKEAAEKMWGKAK